MWIRATGQGRDVDGWHSPEGTVWGCELMYTGIPVPKWVTRSMVWQLSLTLQVLNTSNIRLGWLLRIIVCVTAWDTVTGTCYVVESEYVVTITVGTPHVLLNFDLVSTLPTGSRFMAWWLTQVPL